MHQESQTKPTIHIFTECIEDNTNAVVVRRQNTGEWLDNDPELTARVPGKLLTKIHPYMCAGNSPRTADSASVGSSSSLLHIKINEKATPLGGDVSVMLDEEDELDTSITDDLSGMVPKEIESRISNLSFSTVRR